MKKPSIIINIIFALAIATLFILYAGSSEFKTDSQDNATSSEESKKTAIETTFPVAYIVVDSVMQSYEYYSLLEQQYEREYKREEESMQRKASRFEKEVGEFQHKVQNGLITSKNAEAKQMQLQQKQEELMREQEEVRSVLANKEQELMKELLDSVRSTIRIYNKDKKFEIVLNNAFESNILYATNKLNITKDILSLMNERYAQSKKN
ncbi:MAG: OmpH family outer membrane protein [Bacteroidales bacterium]